MVEKWTQWQVIENLAERYYIKSIYDNTTTLTVILYDESQETKQLRLLFKSGALAYKKTDEILKHRVICDLDEQYGKDFYTKCSFFKITDSKYIQSLIDLSRGALNKITLTHFVVFDPDIALDIIATHEPIIEFLNR